MTIEQFAYEHARDLSFERQLLEAENERLTPDDDCDDDCVTCKHPCKREHFDD